jgi:hypothetical protein
MNSKANWTGLTAERITGALLLVICVAAAVFV